MLGDLEARRAALEQAIEHASHMLPAQGPINVFIHHNTLHAFEDLPFEQAVVEGGKIFGCEPYLSEERFRNKLKLGRIREVDLREVLQRDLGPLQHEVVALQTSRIDMRMAMLSFPLRVARRPELRWFIAETDALRQFRGDVSEHERTSYLARARQALASIVTGVVRKIGPDGHEDLFTQPLKDLPASPEHWSDQTWETYILGALWRVCRQGMHMLPGASEATIASSRPRDLLLQATGVDSDLHVHDVLIRFCAAFLDQGLSHWVLPRREEGFFRAFLGLYDRPGGPPDRWLTQLPQELARIEQLELSPIDSLLESLDLLGIEQAQWDEFLVATLLALRGWGGMIREIEIRGDRVPLPIGEHSLVEFLAVRLILDRLALAHLADGTLGLRGPLSELRRLPQQRMQVAMAGSIEQRAFLVFQLAQVLGWLPTELRFLSPQQWQALVGEIEVFSSVERRRVFHLAFERRYRVQALDAIETHAAQLHEPLTVKFQLVCCLDEREESFRRHLEEIEPAAETYGAAGFFNVPIYFRGVADAHFVPLCPIIIQPRHWVVEDVACTHDQEHDRRAHARRVLGKTSHGLHMGLRTATGGALITAGLGALAAIPLVARVLFPRFTAQIRKLAAVLVQPPSATRLQLERTTAEAGPENGNIGFSVEEMADVAERLLRDIGLTSGFARLVVLLGHGSFSLNNPHNSAYNCGACGGSSGGPNARAFAQLINDDRVRMALRQRGIDVPHQTRFVGAYHNTCNDEVEFFDLDLLPVTHNADVEHLQGVIDETCARNAHERCRRFMSAPLTLSFAAAKRHVEGRSEDLAQTRPELGHATNALCIVARRSRTRGLFLDRRAFLTSYDPTQDDAQGTILLRLLQAAIPVCGGINLEYYFSHVDPSGFGCATKLPHNVTSLLGVMDGAQSDLRTGLPWQMVEIHEAMRLLIVVEVAPDVMLALMERNAGIGRLCRNGWVQLATLDPHSNAMHLLHGDQFEPYRPEQAALPHAAASLDWYQGQRDHLGFAQIIPTTEH